MSAPLLSVDKCTVTFGGLVAVNELSFDLQAGELLGIIGPNGAGKTTAFNVIAGLYRPSRGVVRFDGKSILDLKPYQVNDLGIARTFQNTRLFAELTVLENVAVALHRDIKSSLFAIANGTHASAAEELEIQEKARRMLAEFGLQRRERELAKNLPYGDQRRLEIVRALATSPKLLLLDEPAAGLNTAEKQALMHLIRQLHETKGIAILLIEHDMGVVMQLCPRLIVLDYGVPIARGTPEEIRKNPKVIEAYLGEKVATKLNQ